MTYKPWYEESIPELRELCNDVNYRANLEKRLAELKAVNQHGIRCVMSKGHEAKLEEALHGTD